MSTKTTHGDGTKANPWQLKTPPGTSDYTLYKDEAHDPPILVCKVGTTTLHYDLRCIEDLHAMLKKHGDWMDLGATDEQKPARDTQSKRGDVRLITLSAAGMSSRKAIAAALACTCRPCWKHWGWLSWSTMPRTIVCAPNKLRCD